MQVEFRATRSRGTKGTADAKSEVVFSLRLDRRFSEPDFLQRKFKVRVMGISNYQIFRFSDGTGRKQGSAEWGMRSSARAPNTAREGACAPHSVVFVTFASLRGPPPFETATVLPLDTASFASDAEVFPDSPCRAIRPAATRSSTPARTSKMPGSMGDFAPGVRTSHDGSSVFNG